jgi:hypothetical protein
MPTVRGMIPMEGITQSKIVCGGRMCFLTIISKNDNGMRIIDIRPTFSVANCSDFDIVCAPVSFLSNDRQVNESNSFRFLFSIILLFRSVPFLKTLLTQSKVDTSESNYI